MDEPSPPSAEELGVSEIEYQRILRDLQGRGLGAAENVLELPQARRTSSGRRTWVAVGLIAVLVLVMVGWRAAGPGTSHAPVHAFLQTVDGEPVTYSSCKQVPVAVYPANGPSDAVGLVKEAIAIMRSATGLDIVLVGAYGGHAPNWNFASAPVRPGDPIAISWQDGKAIEEMTDYTAGLGGSYVASGRNGTKYLTAGTIALSRPEYARLDDRGDHAEELAILLHEFGHVFGLDHVDSPGELMYHENIGRTTFGPGDLEGLRVAGRGPCV